MSARDDYPYLARLAFDQSNRNADVAGSALAELDCLRADVSKLLAMLADCGAEWPPAEPQP